MGQDTGPARVADVSHALREASSGPSPWPHVSVGRELARARREWLHTNGAGAYASSTIAGLHTRRYHGLLVAALKPPHERHVFLSHVDATVTPVPGAGPDRAAPSSRPSRLRWELAKHQFPGVDPENSPFYLDRFDQDPLPRWTYRVAGGELEITLALVRGQNAVVLRYAWDGPEPVMLSLRPLLATRGYHELLREHGGMIQRVELRRTEEDTATGMLEAGSQAFVAARPATWEMRVQPRRDLPRVCFRYEGTFVGSPDWWRRFEYLAERDRGLEFQEDLWTPGVFEVPLDGGRRHLVAAVDKLPEGEPADLLETARLALLGGDPGPTASLLVRKLSVAAEVFRADLTSRPGIVGGYPWFDAGARQALPALPGLYLVSGNVEGALRVVRCIASEMADGLVADAAGPSADGTLWLFEAVRHLADVLGRGHPVVKDELRPVLAAAFEALLRGAGTLLRVTSEGLFSVGEPGDARTWMDARVDGEPVTPRVGCPVELTALWARACDTLAGIARAASDTDVETRAIAERERARAGFRARFWCTKTNYPYDVVAEVRGTFDDPRVRPNAVLALAIDPECFSVDQAERVLARVRRDLLTPVGLRSLAPGEPGYLGHYAGGIAARDRAYHQGTVWPWLLGAYVRAALHRGQGDELESLVASAAGNELAVGHVAEIAEGDRPHGPRGAIAHALGTAELLRALAWDLPRNKRR
jgi:glycogen debranching enzyme